MKKLRSFVRWISFGKAGHFKEDFLIFLKFILVRLGVAPYILIYQVGKTGSQTIERTIQEAKPIALVFRTHFLQKKINSFSIPKRQIQCAKRIDHTLKKYTKKIHLITAVREPVSLILASIFQNHSTFFPCIEDITPQKCADLMMKKDNHFFLNWFDEELNFNFGIDIFQKPFPHEKGFFILETERVNLLLYRFENMHSIHSYLEDFLKIKIPKIYNANIGFEKNYKHVYQSVKKEMILPADYLKKMYDEKISKHFYTETERKAFIEHWSQSRA